MNPSYSDRRLSIPPTKILDFNEGLDPKIILTMKPN